MVPQTCRFLALLLSLTVVLSCWMVARYCHRRLPSPVDKDTPGKSRFVAKNAYRHVERLTNFGARVVGSYECDVQAVEYLQTELNKLSNSRNGDRVRMEVDTQKVSGSFYLDRFNVHQKYENVSNVVVRLSKSDSSKTERRPAVLLNCHFDSVPMGPGASDDAVSCGLMLEVIRILLQSPKTELHNDIVFLFNGAEEAILLASHGFITQHPWARYVKAFVNLEAAGSGGRELLFQSGPGHPWLVQSYIKSAVHPFGSIIGEEIFQSGIIPSDTDFRIFRDYGKIPGLDIAFISHGHVYHTEHDTCHRIPRGSVQRAGDNVLAVIHRLSRLKNLQKVGLTTSDSVGTVGTAIYFDFLGLTMVSYPAWVGVIITVVMVISVGVITSRDIDNINKKYDIPEQESKRVVFKIIISFILTIVISVTVNSILGAVLGVLNMAMSWYSRSYILLLLYSLPSMGCILQVFKYLQSTVNVSDAILERLTFNSVNILLAIISSLITAAGYNSAFIFTNSVLFLISWWTVVKTFNMNSSSWKSFLLLHLFLTVPLCQWSYMIQLIFTIFVPIMGRRGAAGNPDVILGVGVAIFTVILLMFIFSFLVAIRSQTFIKSLLGLTFIVIFFLISCTQYGFPYSGDITWPAPKRLTSWHVARSLDSGEDDGGLLVCQQDHLSVQSLLQLPEYKDAVSVSDDECDKMMGCGLPSPSWRQSYQGCQWIPAPPPRLLVPTQLTVEKTLRLGDNVTQMTMAVSGPSRVMLLVSTTGSVTIESWNLGALTPSSFTWRGAHVYQAQLTRGHSTDMSPHLITLTVHGWQGGQTNSGDNIVVSVSGHHQHGANMISPQLRLFKQAHPAWVSLAAWTVDYKYYTL